MKISGKTLKRRLYGVRRLRDRITRARHFRGHGVHSPFVYSIVRQVFMRRGLMEGGAAVNEQLLAAGLPRKRAVQLANLCVHCGYKDVAIGEPRPCDLMVLLQSTAPAQFREYVERARECGATIALMNPCLNRERDKACREITAAHKCTTVDNRGYLLIFNNHLPKQHFKL